MNDKKYNAGLCNIGPKEIVIRQKLLLFSLAGTVGFTMLMHFMHCITVSIFVFACTFFMILLFFEIRSRFCILFGFFKLYNFNDPGNFECVNDKHCNRKDRMKALRIILLSALLALPYAYGVYVFTSG